MIDKKNKIENLVTKSYLSTSLDKTKTEITEYMEIRLDGVREDIVEEVRKETAKVLQGVDKIVTRFDKAEKDHAADKLLHDRHEKRLEKLEVKIL